jgi:hypothetical protein
METKVVDPNRPLEDSSPEVREIVINVLRWEKERLSQTSPRLNSDIEEIIKTAVKEDEN